MTAFKHDEIQQMRTMEGWSRDQESDHLRQTRIANFILSLASVANDLLRLRNAHLLSYGESNIHRDMSQEDFEHKQCMFRIEAMIRQHSIREFGQDIFTPGNPAKLSSPALPPEGLQLGETTISDSSKMSDLREFIRTYFPDLKTDSSPDQIAEMFGLDVTRCPHSFGRAVKGIFAQFMLESFGPPVDPIESPTLPPESAELG